MIMKIHSYVSTNGYLQTVNDKRTRMLEALHKIVQTHAEGKHIEDSWEEALDVARAYMPAISISRDGSEGTRSLDGTPSLTPDIDGTSRSFIDGDVAAALRRRIAEAPGESKAAVGLGLGADASIHANDAHSAVAELTAKVPAQRPEPDYAVLIHHPNDEIRNLADELIELDAELTSTGVQQIRWPENISYRNFADYQLIPTLVYELEYPRTDRCVLVCM
jgi:sterol O-acyltransferase